MRLLASSATLLLEGRRRNRLDCKAEAKRLEASRRGGVNRGSPVMLSGAAVAQDITEVPVEDIQGANQYIADLSTTGDTTLQAESEPVAGGAVTAKPSESPWLMEQQRFGPEATLAVQIPNGVEQTPKLISP